MTRDMTTMSGVSVKEVSNPHPIVTSKNAIRRHFPFNFISGFFDFNDFRENKKPVVTKIAR